MIERTGASRSNEVRIDAVRVRSRLFMSILCCGLIAGGERRSDSNSCSCSVSLLFRLRQVIVLGRDFGVSMLCQMNEIVASNVRRVGY